MKAPRTIALSFALFAANLVHASTITYDAATHLLNAPAGATFSSTGGNLETSSNFGVTFLGIDGAGPEISPGQILTINFDRPQIFLSLTLGLLFSGPDYGDLEETAQASLNLSLSAFTLTATGVTSAVWSLPGSMVTNLSPSNNVGGGVWKVSNPFGDIPVTSLQLTAIPRNPPPGQDQSESDFGLVGFVSRSVPDGGSAGILLAATLGGVFAFLRLQQRASRR